MRSQRSLRLAALASGLAVAACLLGVLSIVSPAGAADDVQNQLAVQRVDARTQTVTVDGNLVGGSLDSLKATVAGKPIDLTTKGAADVPLDAVVVLDNSAALGNATVQLAKQALAPLLPGKGVTRSLGLVTTGGGASVDLGPTTSADAFSAALDEVQPNGDSVTWDGVVRGSELLNDSSNGQRAVILFSASPPVTGSATATTAQSAVSQAGAQMRAVVMPLGADVEAVDNIVGSVGGSVTTAADENQLASAFKNVSAQLGGRFQAQFANPSGDDVVADLTLKAGSQATTVAYQSGSLRTGSISLTPGAVQSEGIAERVLGNPLGLILIVLLGCGAVGLFIWTLLNMVTPGSDSLNRRLKAYEDPYNKDEDEDEVDDGSHTTVPIIQRAVEFTGDVAERRGVLQKLEADLERANLPLRGAEALFFLAAAVVILSVLTFVLTRNLLLTLIVAGLGIMLPRAILSFQVRRRRKAFERQLPDTLTLMAGTLRAGYSIGQGFEAVSTEIDDPMGRELRRVVSETRLGRPLEESLEAVAERMQSDDFGWAVMAIRIQREVGGNLAELLLTVADTMTQRERLRRDVATLTAEGRMSAIVLGALPPGLGLIMWALNGEYMSRLFEPGLGYILCGLALVSMAIGFAWMKKIITIEV